MALELFKFRPKEQSPRDLYICGQKDRFQQFKNNIGKDKAKFLKDIILPRENILEVCLPLQAYINNLPIEYQFYMGYCLHPIIVDKFTNDEIRRMWRSALQENVGLDLSLLHENPLRLNEIAIFNHQLNHQTDKPKFIERISNYHALNLKEKLQLVMDAQDYAVDRLRQYSVI